MGETNVCRECTYSDTLLQIYYSYLMLFADYRLDSILWSPACARMAMFLFSAVVGGDISNFQQLPAALVLGLGVPVFYEFLRVIPANARPYNWGGDL